MTTKLDASHRAVLENWETITQMNQCRDQVQAHLDQTVRKVLHKVSTEHSPAALIPTHDSKAQWYQFEPSRLEKWKGYPHHLLVLGIEGVSAEALLHPTAEQVCFAYVYAAYRTDESKTDSETKQFLTSLNPPTGFSLPRPGQDPEYLFEKLLPALKPEEFCDQSKLEQYFLEPFTALAEWYQANEKNILPA